MVELSLLRESVFQPFALWLIRNLQTGRSCTTIHYIADIIISLESEDDLGILIAAEFCSSVFLFMYVGIGDCGFLE